MAPDPAPSYDRGRLLAADESLNHQIVDTFATAAEADLSWTEKVWASVFAPDRSLQIDVGLGKYLNRNVVDAFAGVSRGREQWTARASRELAVAPEQTSAGPIEYEVIEPLAEVRFALAANPAVPISFDLRIRGILPPFFEERDRRWDKAGFRVVTDLLRYHQPAEVTGWIELEGERAAIEGWTGFRDHSWGIRRNVGAPVPDMRQPSRPLSEATFLMHWSPMFLETPAGERYELQYHLQRGARSTIYSSGNLNRADGSQVRAWRVVPELEFDPSTRRLAGGKIAFDLEDGSRRELEVEAASETGFHLGTGLYMEFDGRHHGSWLGREHLEGEHFADCTDSETLRRIHQLRDCIVEVREGDAVGWGVFESILTGEWPEFGLAGGESFL